MPRQRFRVKNRSKDFAPAPACPVKLKLLTCFRPETWATRGGITDQLVHEDLRGGNKNPRKNCRYGVANFACGVEGPSAQKRSDHSAAAAFSDVQACFPEKQRHRAFLVLCSQSKSLPCEIPGWKSSTANSRVPSLLPARNVDKRLRSGRGGLTWPSTPRR